MRVVCREGWCVDCRARHGDVYLLSPKQACAVWQISTRHGNVLCDKYPQDTGMCCVTNINKTRECAVWQISTRHGNVLCEKYQQDTGMWCAKYPKETKMCCAKYPQETGKNVSSLHTVTVIINMREMSPATKFNTLLKIDGHRDNEID